jgi:hypothetical protein
VLRVMLEGGHAASYKSRDDFVVGQVPLIVLPQKVETGTLVSAVIGSGRRRGGPGGSVQQY